MWVPSKQSLDYTDPETIPNHDQKWKESVEHRLRYTLKEFNSSSVSEETKQSTVEEYQYIGIIPPICAIKIRQLKRSRPERVSIAVDWTHIKQHMYTF